MQRALLKRVGALASCYIAIVARLALFVKGLSKGSGAQHFAARPARAPCAAYWCKDCINGGARSAFQSSTSLTPYPYFRPKNGRAFCPVFMPYISPYISLTSVLFVHIGVRSYPQFNNTRWITCSKSILTPVCTAKTLHQYARKDWCKVVV